jgi:hypothetical protein
MKLVDHILYQYNDEIEYIKNNNIELNGIKNIKDKNKIEIFDCVIINGSDFTSKNELELINGSKYIILVDINSLKNKYNNDKLKNDTNYYLLVENINVRKGFSIYIKI